MSLLITSRELFRQTEVPVMGAKFADRPLMQSQPHRHEFFEIVFVAKGKLINEMRSGNQTLEVNHVLLIGPYVRHCLKPISDNQDIRAFFCSFLPKAIDSSIQNLEDIQGSQSPHLHYLSPFMQLVKDQASANVIKLTSRLGKKCGRLMNEVTQASADDRPTSICKRRYKFLELLMLLADSCSANAGQSKLTEDDLCISPTYHHQGIRRAIKHLHLHSGETIRLEQVAGLSGMSKNAFSVRFKQFTGFTFKTYLNQLRLDHACSMLANSSDSITDICYRVGFNDYSHFSRDFKSYSGLSPREYRKDQQLKSKLDSVVLVDVPVPQWGHRHRKIG